MLARELPESECVARSSDINEIAGALRKAQEGSRGARYAHITTITGKNISGYVLSSEPYMDAVRLPKAFLPTEMASRLITHERWHSRYHPPDHPSRIKGWEIRKAMTDDGPIAIVWAAWITTPMPITPDFT